MVWSLLRSLFATLRSDPSSADDSDGAPADRPDDADGDVWDLIPDWQYDGRHVESGGVARGEQERALRDIQLQAEAIEASEDAAAAASTEE